MLLQKRNNMLAFIRRTFNHFIFILELRESPEIVKKVRNPRKKVSEASEISQVFAEIKIDDGNLDEDQEAGDREDATEVEQEEKGGEMKDANEVEEQEDSYIEDVNESNQQLDPVSLLLV